MGLTVRDGGNTGHGLRAVAIRDSGGPHSLQGMSIRDPDNVLRSVFGALAATAYPPEAGGGGSSLAPINIVSSTSTATPVGGNPPYAYAWSQVSGDAGWSPTNGTSATTTFTASGVSAGTTTSAVFKCTVTDATGRTADTNTVTAEVTNYYHP